MTGEVRMIDRKLRIPPKRVRVGAALLAMLVAPVAQASFLQGEALDTMANVIAWIVLIVIPIGFIAVFWIVHVLPEKIAEKRHHPNKEAIHVLCLLSLVFGGLLWPIAWLWAYTRPVGHKLAFGTEKHDDYYIEQGDLAARGALNADEVEHLRLELEHLKQRGLLTPELKRVYARLQALALKPGAADTKAGVV
jgi:CBS domain containing-hemolysin-like protein